MDLNNKIKMQVGMTLAFCYLQVILVGCLQPLNARAESSLETCHQLATFDVVCNYSSSIIILSARPCSSGNVYLTKFNKDYSLNMSNPIDKTTTVILDNKVTLVIHQVAYKGYLSSKDYRKNRVEVKVSMTRKLLVNGIFDFTFLMLQKNCFHPNASSRLDDIDTKKQESYCDNITDLGDFSQSCSITAERLIPKGIYVTFIDFCTVPFSFTVLSVTDDIFNAMRYTETKTDVVIPVSKRSRNSGLLLQVEIHKNFPTIYDISLKFNTSDKTTYCLTNKKYGSSVGMMCPLHECIHHSKVNQICHPWWIDYQNATYKSKIYIDYDPCQIHVQAHLDISLDNDIHLKFRSPMTLTAYGENVLKQGSQAKPLQLGYWIKERQYGKELYNNGYMLLDKGKLTLYASRNLPDGLVHITVIRHYLNGSIPLLRTEFWVSEKEKQSICLKNKGSKHRLRIGIIISAICFVFFILVVLSICIYKKRLFPRGKFRPKKKPREEGLPYQIQLQEGGGEDEEEQSMHEY